MFNTLTERPNFEAGQLSGAGLAGVSLTGPSAPKSQCVLSGEFPLVGQR
jgi:hypothetical protein